MQVRSGLLCPAPDFNQVYGPFTDAGGHSVQSTDLHAGEALLSASLAQGPGAQPGDRLQLAFGEKIVAVTVRALLSNDIGVTTGEAIASATPQVILPLAAAQQIDSEPPDTISIRNTSAASNQAVMRFLQQLFPGASARLDVPHALGQTSFDTFRIHPLQPDVVLMDLVMPGMDGIEATRLLKQRSPRTQVIVLTSYHEDEHIFPAIRAGALSYLLKDVLLPELANAVRKAAAGEPVMNPHVAARIAQELRSLPEIDRTHYTQLSEREQEVLRLIAEGFPNSEIARRLVISEKTVKSHVSNILSKLHLLDRTQAPSLPGARGWSQASQVNIERTRPLNSIIRCPPVVPGSCAGSPATVLVGVAPG